MATDRGSDATRTSDLSVWRETTSRTAGSKTRTSRKQQTSARWNRALSLTAKIAGVTGATVLLVVGLLYARLLAGPISLTFLASHIQEALEREFAGLGVLIEDVSARLTDAGTVSFELSNIRVVDEGGAPLAYAPSASLSLSRKALNAGRLAPETIDLISPRLLLYYSEDGSLSVKFTPPGDNPRRQRGQHAGPARQHQGRGRAEGGSNRLDAVALRPRQDAVGSLRPRPPPRARQRLFARRGLEVGDRHPRQRQPQEHLAGARSRYRSRSPPQPQLDRRPRPHRVAERSVGGQLPHHRSSQRQQPAAQSVRAEPGAACPGALGASVRHAGRRRCAGMGRGPARGVERRPGAERHHRHRHRPRQGLDAVAGRTPRAGRWRPPRAVLRRFGAPLRDRAVGARLGRQPRAVHRPDRAHRAGRGRAALGLRHQVGRRLARGGPAHPPAHHHRRLARARLPRPRARPRRAQSVRAACGRRRGVRSGRHRRDDRSHAGAPGRQDQPHVGRHLQGAVAQHPGAQVARVGGAPFAARQPAGRHLPGRLRRRRVGHRLDARRTATRVAGDRRLRSRHQRARRLAGAGSAARPGAPGGRQPRGDCARCRHDRG